MSLSISDSTCPKCFKYQPAPVVWVRPAPELRVSCDKMCQDCYMALLYTEEERKQLSVSDARVEPSFHQTHRYGIPFVGRDGVRSVRIQGRSSDLVLIYDHPALIQAQTHERERQCAMCMKWDKVGMAWEAGIYPHDRLWCSDCREKLRRSRLSARPMIRSPTYRHPNRP